MSDYRGSLLLDAETREDHLLKTLASGTRLHDSSSTVGDQEVTPNTQH